MHSMLTWIEHTGVRTAIPEGGLPYPIIGGIHLLAIALFGGTLLMADLRLLGWAMQTYRFSEVWRRFLPWKRLGFGVGGGRGEGVRGAGLPLPGTARHRHYAAGQDRRGALDGALGRPDSERAVYRFR